MILFKLSWHAFCRNLKINLLIIVQTIIALMICIAMVCSVTSRYRFYAPFKDVLEGKGMYCMMQSSMSEKYGSMQVDYRNQQELVLDRLYRVEEIFTQYAPYLFFDELTDYDGGVRSERFACISYEDNVLTRYTPDLAAGRWLLPSDQTEHVEAVICQRGYDYKLGDHLTGKAITYENEPLTVDVEIVGILSEDAKLFGGSSQYDSFATFKHLYQGAGELLDAKFYMEDPNQEEPEESEDKPCILLILSNQTLDRMDVVTFFSANASGLIRCADSITPSAETMNNYEISMLLNTPSGQSLPAVQERSMRYITNQLSMLTPVLLCILCLTCMSFVSGSSIITKRNMHDFGVYFLCGMGWNRCLLIQLCNSALISLFSLVCSMLLAFACGWIPGLQGTNITFGGWQLLCCVGLLLVNLLISVLLPAAILGRTTPNQILKSN